MDADGMDRRNDLLNVAVVSEARGATQSVIRRVRRALPVDEERRHADARDSNAGDEPQVASHPDDGVAVHRHAASPECRERCRSISRSVIRRTRSSFTGRVEGRA